MPFAVIVQRRQLERVQNAKKVDKSLKKQPWVMSTSALMAVEGERELSVGFGPAMPFCDFHGAQYSFYISLLVILQI